jgi:prophage regulatory protein
MATKPNINSEKSKRAYPATLPETGYLRLPQIIGDPNTDPPTPAIFPIGKSSWWDGIKSGKYPKGEKLGPNTTVWRVEAIRALLEAGAA